MFFSVIVPVYNVEKYLAECVDSLIDRQDVDYEVLLIDDGSTDRSPQLCDAYAEQYGFIRTFHKQNGGLSDARNYGVDRAQGDYLVFIDSDDWIAQGALRTFSGILAERPADVLITRLTEVFPERSQSKDEGFSQYLQEPFTRDRALKWETSLSKNAWPAPKTIVSRRLIEDNGIRFPYGRLHEDMDWTAHILLHAKTYAGCGDEWYFHRMQREGSITSTIRGRNISDTVMMAADFFDETEDDRSEETAMIRNRIMGSVYAKLNELKKCPKEEQSEVIETVKNNIRIFAVAPERRHRLFVSVMKMIGPKAALGLLNRING